MKYYLGMDIGGTKCAVVLSEKSGVAVKDKIRFETKARRGWEAVVDELVSSAKELLSRNGLSKDDIIACGVSCGGPLDSDKGIIMRPPNLPDWDNVPLADIVTAELGCPCKVRNDADACALAEWKFGAGIAAMAKQMLSIYNGNTDIPKDDISAKTVAEAAENGDRLAGAIYRRCGEKLGLGLSILIDILNPERIVIGSIFQRSGHLLRESMNEVIKKEALPISAGCCEIVPAQLGDNIGDFAAIGVAKDFAEGEK